ncbi:hypothetical protein RN001_008672 [Aquatica leii]|uniref:Transposase domain-containing protein n=1 Tax=Aquatica leii TaxID=1421715 RepID=A0AAN7PDL9_9COLE|nr:hypothetical protein RN001_008672 [Aquatica leii]
MPKLKSTRQLNRQLCVETRASNLLLNDAVKESSYNINYDGKFLHCNKSQRFHVQSHIKINCGEDNSNNVRNVLPVVEPIDRNTFANSYVLDNISVDYSENSDNCSNNGVTNNNPVHLKLSNWALTDNISHSSFYRLLNILRTEKDPSQFKTLPKDPRTLLHTPTNVKPRNLDPGVFYYFGIEKSLNTMFQQNNYNITENDVFELAVNIDGLPLSNSSASNLWPILAQVKSLQPIENIVFMVAVFHGKEKPTNVNEYLTDFVNEIIILSNQGICIREKYYKFKLSMLICDAPAKSYVLCIKNHTGYSSCTKCTAEGDFINNVLCFSDIENLKSRSDCDFRRQSDEAHHIGTTILTKIPNFNMVSDVPIDYMHLLCLGVMKRLLVNKRYGWVFGKQPYKLPYRDVQLVSNTLVQLNKFVPSEFCNRRTRPIEECKRYKATEFRLLLLYTGPLVFKKYLKPRYYHNFLILHVASLIMCSENFHKSADMLTYAKQLMIYFVKKISEDYGYDFISYNVHNLLHLADDVVRFGNLHRFSSFPFENYMQLLKKLVRKSEKPLQQIINRVFEFSYIQQTPKHISHIASNEHYEGNLPENCRPPQYKTVKTIKYTLKTNLKDCYVQLFNDDIVKINNFAYCGDELNIIGKTFLEKSNFFTIPCNSSLLGIFCLDLEKLSHVGNWKLTDIKHKLIFVPFENNLAVVYPLLH